MKTDIDSDNLIIGRNAVSEALKSGRIIDSVLVADKEISGSLRAIVSKAKENKITIKFVGKKTLDGICIGNNQGVIAVCGAKSTCTVDDILNYAKSKNEPPFIIIADEIEDPHNLGAIIRTAECAGVHGVIIPKRRSAGLTYGVEKASAGALEYVKIARVGNISSAIDYLKNQGVWIYGTDVQGNSPQDTDLTGATALVIGSEGKGMGRLVREKCDYIISLPMKGKINSLNASVASGILMYEVMRQKS